MNPETRKVLKEQSYQRRIAIAEQKALRGGSPPAEDKPFVEDTTSTRYRKANVEDAEYIKSMTTDPWDE